MKHSNLALLSLFAFASLTTVACGSKDDGNAESFDTTEAQLVADSDEATEADDAMESGVEEPLSGALQLDPGTPAEGADLDAILAKVKSNVGKWFQPAGCITTTFTGNIAKHVFAGCTGPYGMRDFDGTVTTTYTLSGDTLTITHEATGFKTNGAEITGSRVVTYSRADGVVTKHRTGSWSGTTKNGKAFTHEADFTVTWTPSTRCITRDGSAESTIGARSVSHAISDYERCGLGYLGCPTKGTITLERTKGEKSSSVVLTFLGGRDFTLTGPNGRTRSEKLVCIE